MHFYQILHNRNTERNRSSSDGILSIKKPCAPHLGPVRDLHHGGKLKSTAGSTTGHFLSMLSSQQTFCSCDNGLLCAFQV